MRIFSRQTIELLLKFDAPAAEVSALLHSLDRDVDACCGTGHDEGMCFVANAVESGIDPDKILLFLDALDAFWVEAPKKERAARAKQEEVFVYVIAVDHPGEVLVKVGISKHPHYRRETLERERDLNLFVAHTEGPYERSVAAAIERDAHAILLNWRETGEWFVCGVDAAIKAVSASAARAVQ